METIFKVGDKVWDMSISNEPGEVVQIREGDKYPIKVNFIDCSNTYTFDGVRYIGYTKTLSLTPYTFEGFSQERPKKEPEIGSFCLFSDYDIDIENNIGKTGILHSIEKEYYVSNAQIEWRFCKQIEIKDV